MSPRDSANGSERHDRKSERERTTRTPQLWKEGDDPGEEEVQK